MARTPNENTFAQLISHVGFDRAQLILQEEQEKAGLRISPHKQRSLAAQGADILSRVGVEIKRGGAPIDPNSAQQRVWAEVKKTLGTNPHGVDMRDKWDAIAKKLGLKVEVVKRNAMKTPGVHRTYGVWKLG